MNPIEEKLKPIQFSETQEEGEPLSFQFQNAISLLDGKF